MNFLYPDFLFALAALSIPIIIHLFNFRRYKKIFFANVSFLNSVKEQTQSKSQLKHLLVLLARLLTITFLVFAFAQPYIPFQNKKVAKGQKNISIYVDNSFSMNTVTQSGTALNNAVAKAKEIVSAYKPTAKFQLLDNDFSGAAQHFYSKDALPEKLTAVKTSPTVRNADETLSRMEDLLKNASGNNKEIYFVSDFQANAFNIEKHRFDSTINYHFVPVISQLKNNVYIDSCWFESPVHNINTDETLHVKIVNNGTEKYENIPLKLTLDGKIKSPAAFSLKPHETKVVDLHFKNHSAGFKSGSVKISDYPITFDDALFVSFKVVKQINVLNITGENNQKQQSDPIAALFSKDNFINFSSNTIDNINFSSLSTQNLIILDDIEQISDGLQQTLIQFIKQGGSVLFFPSADANLTNINNFITDFNGEPFTAIDTTKLRATQLNLNQQIFKNVFAKKPENIDVPIVKLHFKTANNSRVKKQNIIGLENNDDFLSQYNFGKGKIFICTAPLNQKAGNFGKHALFVPVIYDIALYSQKQNPIYYKISGNEAIAVQKSDDKQALYHIQAKDFDIIPEVRSNDNQDLLFTHEQIKQAGIYRITQGKNIIDKVAFNYNRKESDLKTLNINEIQTEINKLKTKAHINIISGKTATLSKQINTINKGTPLWKLCIILALLFIAIEILLLKFWK